MRCSKVRLFFSPGALLRCCCFTFLSGQGASLEVLVGLNLHATNPLKEPIPFEEIERNIQGYPRLWTSSTFFCLFSSARTLFNKAKSKPFTKCVCSKSPQGNPPQMERGGKKWSTSKNSSTKFVLKCIGRIQGTVSFFGGGFWSKQHELKQFLELLRLPPPRYLDCSTETSPWFSNSAATFSWGCVSAFKRKVGNKPRNRDISDPSPWVWESLRVNHFHMCEWNLQIFPSVSLQDLHGFAWMSWSHHW